MSEVWINDVDLADYGFVLGADPKHGASPDLSDATAPLLGALGPIWLGEPVQAASRSLTIAGNLLCATQAAYLQAVDAIKGLVSNGAVRLRFADRPTQEFRDARLLNATPTSRSAILANRSADLSLAFAVADPVRYDVEPQGVALSTTRAALLIGTAPSSPLINVSGGGASVTNVTLTYRNAAGDIIQTMGLTGVLAAGDFLIVDCVKAQVTVSVSGVQSDALSWWTSGDFPIVRAADGSQELSQWPTLELSASSGTPSGLITYARAWL